MDWNAPQPSASALGDHGDAQLVEVVEEEQPSYGFSGPGSMQPAEIAAPLEASPPEEPAGFGFSSEPAVQQDAPADVEDEVPPGFGSAVATPAEDGTETKYGF